MIQKVVFLLEESSIEMFLNGFLPRMLSDDWQWRCIPHQGKSDLEKSIPRKLRAWQEPNVRFVVIRDQDSGDCRTIKTRLQELCENGQKPNTLIRIACRELESWFLGDLQAVDTALGINRLASLQNKVKNRDPDRRQKPSKELKRLVSGYQKRMGARAISPFLGIEGNRSKSFNVFVSGIQKYLSE